MDSQSHILGVDVLTVAACHLEPSQSAKNTLSSLQAIQTTHRLRILEAWGDASSTEKMDWSILQGQVIEIGCGQGDQTAATAALMKETPELTGSKVLGVDPAPPEYGAPFTLAQAQEYILKSAVAKHLQFSRYDTARQALESQPSGFFRSIIFSHCLWYFASQSQVIDAFSAARSSGVQYLLFAEWDLSSREGEGKENLRPSSVPHLLAVLLQSHKSLARNNIQLPLSPPMVKKLASLAGWKVESERVLTPSPYLQDGQWEAGTAIAEAKNYLKARDSESGPTGDTEQVAIEAGLYALQQHLPPKMSDITSLDVWTCKFVPA